MSNKKILLVDNSLIHLNILNEELKKADFDVQIIKVDKDDNTLVLEQIKKLLSRGEKFLLIIDIWLTQYEETHPKSSYSGVELALKIYSLYKKDYGINFVISLLTAYDLGIIISEVEKILKNDYVNIPLENDLDTLNDDEKNLPFYVIKKPIYNNKLRSDRFPASLYEKLTGKREYDYLQAMINVIDKRFEMLK